MHFVAPPGGHHETVYRAQRRSYVVRAGFQPSRRICSEGVQFTLSWMYAWLFSGSSAGQHARCQIAMHYNVLSSSLTLHANRMLSRNARTGVRSGEAIANVAP